MVEHVRTLTLKEPGQEYGQITKSLGNGYMQVQCFTSNGGVSKRAHIRGTMRKKVWMSVGDVVLVSIRDFEDATCDIVFKYTSDEARTLRARKYIPDSTEINENETEVNESVVFDNASDQNIDDL